MKTKPFNLEEALNGAKVVTRDRREVTQLTKFESEAQDLIFGKIDKCIFAWRLNGNYYNEGASGLDLLIAVDNESSIEFIFSEMYKIISFYAGIEQDELCQRIKQQAKEMHKEEMIDFSFKYDDYNKLELSEFYNETYGGNK